MRGPAYSLGTRQLPPISWQYEKRGGSQSDIELLLCTEFCDKRTILKKSLPFDSQGESADAMPMSKGGFEAEVKRIEGLRNPLAHASSYAMKWDEVASLSQTVKTLVKWRERIKDGPS